MYCFVGWFKILLCVKYFYRHNVVLLKFGHVCCRTALERKRDTLECVIKKDHTGLSWEGYILCFCSSAVFTFTLLYTIVPVKMKYNKTVQLFQYCILLLFMLLSHGISQLISATTALSVVDISWKSLSTCEKTSKHVCSLK